MYDLIVSFFFSYQLYNYKLKQYCNRLMADKYNFSQSHYTFYKTII